MLLVEDDEVNSLIMKQMLEDSPMLRSLELRVDAIPTVEAMLELYAQSDTAVSKGTEGGGTQLQKDWVYSVMVSENES